MTYSKGLETNAYYMSLRRKVKVSTLKSPVHDLNKCLSFNLDQKSQSIVATAWHSQNIYFDPYQTVICPIKGKIKWNIQKPYLPPKKRWKRKDKGWESVDFFKNKKRKLNEHPDDMLALWQPSYGGQYHQLCLFLVAPLARSLTKPLHPYYNS